MESRASRLPLAVTKSPQQRLISSTIEWPPPPPRHCVDCPIPEPFIEHSNTITNRSPSLSQREQRSPSRAFWKRHLFLLQEAAPKPKCVKFNGTSSLENKPTFYSEEYHGDLSREKADSLLEAVGDGAYLVRESRRALGTYTLCIRFDQTTKNYKLYHDDSKEGHYVGDKKFDSVLDLVHDGLIAMFIEKHAADYIHRMADETVYDETPYSQYKRHGGAAEKLTLPTNQIEAYGSASSTRQSKSYASETNGCKESLALNSTDKMTIGANTNNCLREHPALTLINSILPNERVINCKAHKFKTHTFKGPHWCDWCGNFMWGLVQQGVKCEDCGYGSHRKCAEKIPQDCRPDIKYVRRVFGVDLTTLTMAHQTDVPDVVLACVCEIEARGVDQEGIYRVSGSHDEIERLRQAVDNDGRVDLTKEKVEDINSVAGLLKLFLRSLPQPLITDCAHGDLLRSVRRRLESDRMRGARDALTLLPLAHRSTLHLLLRHLARIARHSPRNKMDAENLARVFAPTLMARVVVPPMRGIDARLTCAKSSAGGGSPDASMLLPQHDQLVLQYLITNVVDLFRDL